MTRILYRFLLDLHPREFREEFADEMLWIFDEAGESLCVLPLFADVFKSLWRQWLVRSGAWAYAVGVMVNGALLAALSLGPQSFGGAANQVQLQAEPEPPHVHYRLYMYVEQPSWKDSQQVAQREP